MGNRVKIDETDLFVLGDIGGKVNASEGIQIEIGEQYQHYKQQKY